MPIDRDSTGSVMQKDVAAYVGAGGGGSNITNDNTWANKGDLIVGVGSHTAQILPKGTDTFVLTADGTTTTGLKWAAAAGGGGGSVKFAGIIDLHDPKYSTPINGTTNALPAITAAIADTPTGGAVQFGPYRYAISATIDLSARLDITFLGAGGGPLSNDTSTMGTVLLTNGGAFPAVTISPVSTAQHGPRLIDINVLDGSGVSDGFYVKNCNLCFLGRCSVKYANRSFVFDGGADNAWHELHDVVSFQSKYGFYLNANFGINVHGGHVFVPNNTSYGVFGTGQAQSNKFFGLTIDGVTGSGTGAGIGVGCDTGGIHDWDFYGMKLEALGTAFDLVNTGGTPTRAIKISGGSISAFAGTEQGVNIHAGVDRVLVDRVHFTGPYINYATMVNLSAALAAGATNCEWIWPDDSALWLNNFAAAYVPTSYHLGRVKSTLMNANCTSVASAPDGYAGARLVLIFTQDPTGGRTLPAVGSWTGYRMQTVSNVGNTANKQTNFEFVHDGTNWVQIGGPNTWFDSTGGGGPIGAAGGDLTGTYPNPTLAAAGPGATGPIGDSTHTPVVTIDAKGRVTALTSAAISSGSGLPSGTIVPTGLVGNGIADDTTAIQTAIAALPASGGEVWLPSGTFKTTATLDLGLLVSLVGRGMTATQIFYTGSSNAINIGIPSQTVAPLVCSNRVSNLTVNGNGSGTAGSVGIRIIKCLFPRVEGVRLENLESALVVDGSDLWVANGTISSLVTQSVKFGITHQSQSGKQVNQMVYVGGYIGGDATANARGVRMGTGTGYLGGASKFFGTHVEGFTGTGAIGWHLVECGDPGDTFFSIGYEACTTGLTITSSSVSNLFVGLAEHPSGDTGINTMIMGGAFTESAESLRFVGWSATITPDLTQGTVKEISPMTGATTIANPVQTGQQGQHLYFMLQQDGTGSRAVTWGSKYKVLAGAVSATANLRSSIHFIYNAYDDIWVQVGGTAGIPA